MAKFGWFWCDHCWRWNAHDGDRCWYCGIGRRNTDGTSITEREG